MLQIRNFVQNHFPNFKIKILLTLIRFSGSLFHLKHQFKNKEETEVSKILNSQRMSQMMMPSGSNIRMYHTGKGAHITFDK